MINYSIDFKVKKSHRQQISLSVFYWIQLAVYRNKVVYTDWGALLQEFCVWVIPRSVTCVHKTMTPRMKHTRVPWDGTQGFSGQLSRRYRYQAFTFFEAESGIRLKVKSKTGKSRMDRADRETETQKTKKSTYLSHAEVLKPGQIDEVQCVRKVRTFL